MKKYKFSNKIKGTFNGFSVAIKDVEDMKNIMDLGYFGKGNFSRSYPVRASNNLTEIIRNRQYNQRTQLAHKTNSKSSKFRKIIIVPDSDDEYEHFFDKLTPLYNIDKSELSEELHLSLEEAFFLANCLKILDVYQDLNCLNLEQLWRNFSNTDPYFVYNYVVYCYFRSKNWIVKPGIKFGGDFVLYKQGPSSFHASYVVIIDILNEHHERIDRLAKRSMDNMSLLCLHRLCETTGKELIICEVVVPNEHTQDTFKNLNNCTVKEILLNRWTEADGYS